MAVVIRLNRQGTKKRPFYHIVVVDKRVARNTGNVLERVGTYNPMLPKDHADRIKMKTDRIQYWMSQGAKPSDRIYSFLVKANLAEKRAIPEQTKAHLQKEKTVLRIKDKQEKLAKIEAEKKAAEEAKAAAEAAAKNTPAEEVSAETTEESAE